MSIETNILSDEKISLSQRDVFLNVSTCNCQGNDHHNQTFVYKKSPFTLNSPERSPVLPWSTPIKTWQQVKKTAPFVVSREPRKQSQWQRQNATKNTYREEKYASIYKIKMLRCILHKDALSKSTGLFDYLKTLVCPVMRREGLCYGKDDQLLHNL
jgi:hypothetical protein